MNENRASVSVIVPVYNAKDYLERCVKSVLDQTYKDFELILIDDGSTDGSAELCDSLCANDPRAKVVHQKNAGVGVARNVGLDMAKGKYIEFVDSDDAILPETLEEVVKAGERYSADFVFFGMANEVKTPDGSYKVVEEEYMKLEGYFTRKEICERFREFWTRPFPCPMRVYRRDYVNRLKLRFSTQTTEEDGLFNVAAYSGDFSGVVFIRKLYYRRLVWPGSASFRYHPDRFDNQLNVNRAIERLTVTLGYCGTKESQRFVAREYVKGLNVAMRNLALPAGKKTVSQRRAALKKWLSIPEIKRSVEIMDRSLFNSTTEWIKFYLIKKRWLTLAVVLQKLYVSINR